uniref:RNase H type-1 domain-containing protein n=1 Tax=Solanum lycopersicum TaxID=4081 RepID=A0A3Q7E8V9_SOLLC
MKEDRDGFFVVKKGDIVGVYRNLGDCQTQVGSSICDPPVSVYKGYSMPKDTEEYLLSCGLKNALYSIRAADLTESLFGALVPCPFQHQSSSKGGASEHTPKKRSQEAMWSEYADAVGSVVASNDSLRKHIKLEPPKGDQQALSSGVYAVGMKEADRGYPQQRSCTLEFDGTSKGNPGQAGAGAVVRADDGSLICRLREGLGIATTSVAEYRGFILGLKYAHSKGFTSIRAQGDSKLVCMQIQGLWKVKNQNISTLFQQAKQLKDRWSCPGGDREMTNGAVDDDSKRGANEDLIVLTTEHRVLPANWRCSPAISFYSDSTKLYNRSSIRFYAGNRNSSRIRCNLKATGSSNNQPETSTGIQLYRDIERLLTETVKQSQDWGSSQDWDEIEGAWVLQPKTSKPKLVVHFIGGVFVGAAPQLSYRLFLERLRQKLVQKIAVLIILASKDIFAIGCISLLMSIPAVSFYSPCQPLLDVLVIATPYASGFDHFYIADEVQFKFDRCLRFLQERVQDLPVFGIGHSLGSVIHLLIGARYAVKRNGNVLMAFNNKDASLAVPLFSSVLVPMMQNLGPVLSQIASSPTIRLGAEMTMKQIENLSPSIMKQVFPLVEQLTPLYTDLINGKENFTPRPEETQRLIRSYYGISRNLLVKFKDDTIDETSTLAQVLSSGSAISSMLDMSIRTLPGDHALPLQQALPNAPPGMTDAVNRSSELLANLTAGTPWENVTKEVGNTLGNVDSIILNSGNSKDLDMLVETITSWMYSNTGPKLLQ